MTALTLTEVWLSSTSQLDQDGDAPAAGWDLWVSDRSAGTALVITADQSLSTSDSASVAEVAGVSRTVSVSDAASSSEATSQTTTILAVEQIGTSDAVTLDAGSSVAADVAADWDLWLADASALDTLASTPDTAMDSWLSERRAFIAALPSSGTFKASTDHGTESEAASLSVANPQTEAVSATETVQVAVLSLDMSVTASAEWDLWLADQVASPALAETAASALDTWVSNQEALSVFVPVVVAGSGTKSAGDGGSVADAAQVTISSRAVVTWVEFEVPAASATQTPTATDSGTLSESVSVVTLLVATDSASMTEQGVGPNSVSLTSNDVVLGSEAASVVVASGAPPTFGSDSDEGTITETATLTIALIDQDGTVTITDSAALATALSASQNPLFDEPPVIAAEWDRWLADGWTPMSLVATEFASFDAWIASDVPGDVLSSSAVEQAAPDSDSGSVAESTAFMLTAIAMADAAAMTEVSPTLVSSSASTDQGAMREQRVLINGVVAWPKGHRTETSLGVGVRVGL